MTKHANEFTPEQTAAAIEASRFANADQQPVAGAYDFRRDFLDQLTRYAQKKASKELRRQRAPKGR